MNKFLKVLYSQSSDKLGRAIRKIFRNKYERKKLENKNFTIISQNCIGSIMYHDLGLKFLSPTINMLFSPTDFIKFLEHINEYLSENVEFLDTDNEYPVGRIKDITINFVHYKNNEEATKKWNERKKRINWNNIYIIACDDNMSDEDVKKFSNMSQYRNKILFTNNKEHLIKDSIYINNIFEKADARLLNFCDITGKRYYQKVFNYVDWINNKN